MPGCISVRGNKFFYLWKYFNDHVWYFFVNQFSIQIYRRKLYRNGFLFEDKWNLYILLFSASIVFMKIWKHIKSYKIFKSQMFCFVNNERVNKARESINLVLKKRLVAVSEPLTPARATPALNRSHFRGSVFEAPRDLISWYGISPKQQHSCRNRAPFMRSRWDGVLLPVLCLRLRHQLRQISFWVLFH